MEGQVQEVVGRELELQRVHVDQLVDAVKEEDEDGTVVFGVAHVVPGLHGSLRGPDLGRDKVTLRVLTIGSLQ